MIAALSRPPETLSRRAAIVCFCVPAIFFGMIVVAFVFLDFGLINLESYSKVRTTGIVVGFLGFLILSVTDYGVGIIVEVKQKLPMTVSLFLFTLMVLTVSLPWIFGLV